MTSNAPFVHVDNVAKRWNGQLGVENISLSIPQGAFVALLGPSGCGKSTTLRLLSGLELPDEGQIVIDGRNVTHAAPSERNLSMVFQSYALFPHLSVAENVVFGLKVRKVSAADRREKLARALEITGSYRKGVLSVIIFFVVGLLVLLKVDVRRGAIAAGNEPPARN